MNATLYRRLFAVGAASMNSNLCSKLFAIHPFHFHNIFSREAHTHSLFSQFASSRLNMSEAQITRMLKVAPQLQKLKDLQKAEQFIHSFKKYGCTEVQIAKIIRLRPSFITSSEGLLERKIKVLEDFGFLDRNLAKLVTCHPAVLCYSVENELLPKMEFLKNVFQSKDVLVKALLRSPRLVCYSLEKKLKPSFAFWKGWGFSGTALVSFLTIFPVVLTCTSLTPAQMDLIHKICPDKESGMFKYIVSIVAVSRLETLEAKIENLKLCGLSDEEIWQLLGVAPLVFYYSKENVTAKMNILVNNLELPANYVVKHPSILSLNLEKTVRPRLLVWQKIKSTDAFRLPLLKVLRMTEKRFVSKIIEGHPESKILWTIYENAISNASNRTTSSTKDIILDGESESQDSKTTTN